MTNDKTNKMERTADGVTLVRDYSQGIQYRTFRTVLNPAKVPAKIRRAYGLDKPYAVTALVRFDDTCKNGHCTFSITGRILDSDRRRNDQTLAAGCIHDLLAIAFPELSQLIQWHLTSTDGPMHYVANTVYHAGDRDSSGLRAGDVSQWELGVRFGNSPVTHKVRRAFWEFLQSRAGTGEFQVTSIAYGEQRTGGYQFKPKFTFVGFGEKWHDCPFDSQVEADEFCTALNNPAIGATFVKIPTAYSEGKTRDLDAARHCAVWPNATDAELSVSRAELTQVLQSRLVGLLAEFRAAVESCGFDYDFPAKGGK